jgi:hypothetical protein
MAEQMRGPRLRKREELLQAMAHGSAAAWGHLNLLGEHDFSERQASGFGRNQAPKTDRLKQVPSWEFRNRRKSFTPRQLARILWDFTYLCWANPMIQKLLAQPHWQGKLTPRDYAALTPLIWEHVNPYGRFDLDMNTRLALL